MHYTRFAILLVGALAFTGCGNSNQAAIVPIEGKITFADGKPLPTGTRLLFNPESGKMGTATGTTDESGAFRVVHSSGRSGAAVGKYTIQVMAPEGQGAEFYKVVPRTYFDNGGTLTVEVIPNQAPLSFTIVTAPAKK